MEEQRLAARPALAAIIDAQGRTQRWLADQAGVSVFTLSRIVSGKSKVAHPVAIKIAASLQTPLFLAFDTTPVHEIDTEEKVSA